MRIAAIKPINARRLEVILWARERIAAEYIG
jgi:hypothetical protein